MIKSAKKNKEARKKIRKKLTLGLRIENDFRMKIEAEA
jgi:hypothetical protein